MDRIWVLIREFKGFQPSFEPKLSQACEKFEHKPLWELTKGKTLHTSKNDFDYSPTMQPV